MAAFCRHLTSLLLFVLALTQSQVHVHARESKFFSKVTQHISEKSKGTMLIPVAPPGLLPSPAPSPVSVEVESGYGSSDTVPTREMNSAASTFNSDFENKISGEELTGESFTTGYGNGYLDHFNYNGNANARLAGGYSTSDAYATGSQQQGMSDTRYLENGKYYYDLKGENRYVNGYEPEKRTSAGNTYNANENDSSAYEFDTMEEYYRKQGIIANQDQQVYAP